MQNFRRLRHRKHRARLMRYFWKGVRIAHLPAYTDREPVVSHRAYRSAFMRGFIAERQAMTLPTIVVYRHAS